VKQFISLILILLFCNYGYTAENWGIIDIPDFSGGLNTRDNAGGIADNELQESFNCYLLANGVVKRQGYESYNDSARINSANEGTGIISAPFITGGTKIVGTAGTKIAYKGTNEWIDITGSVTLTTDKPMLFTMINNNLVGVNGTNPAWYWSGSGNAVTFSGKNIPTAPATCETFHGRLFLSQGRRLYWSGYMGKWKEFHPDDYQDVEGTITGLKVYGDINESNLIIFTNNSIHRCVFEPSIGANVGGRGVFRFNTISEKHGCISQFSIQECLTTEGAIALIWADNDGLKALYGDTVVKLTDKIQPDWDNLNIDDLNESVGIHYKPKRWYLLSCSRGRSTTNNRIIVFDLRNWVVAGYFDWQISAFGIVRDDGVDKLIGSDYSGYWNTYDSGNSDCGSGIDAYFSTKSFDGNEPFIDKGFSACLLQHTYYGEYNLDIKAYYDYATDSYSTSYTVEAIGTKLGVFLLGTDKLIGTGGLVTKAAEIKGRGKNIYVRISNSDADEPFKIYGMKIIYSRGRMVLAK